MENRKGGMPKISIVIMLILMAGMIYFMYSGMMNNSHYKYHNFLSDLKAGKVKSVTVNQNKEIPTGQLVIKLKDNTKEEVYVTNVNKVLNDIEDYNKKASKDIYPTIKDVDRDSVFLTTILPMVFMGIIVLVVIMMTNAMPTKNNKLKTYPTQRIHKPDGTVAFTLKKGHAQIK